MLKVKFVLPAVIITSLFISPVSNAGESGDIVKMQSYLCKDIMRMSGEERDISLAVLHGYMLGKKGVNQFSSSELGKVSDQFVEHCLDHPMDKAMEAFARFSM